jgi:hypothetical protein
MTPMPDLSMHQLLYRDQTGEFDNSAVRMTVTDYGETNGIDISVYDPFTGVLCFEWVVLDPDDCLLLGHSTQSTAAFDALCLRLRGGASKSSASLRIELQNCEAAAFDFTQRSSRILRMVENVADEIQTYELGSKVDVFMRTSNGDLLSLM